MIDIAHELPGLPLEKAQEKLRRAGLEMRVAVSRAPRCSEDHGTPRVVRAKDGVLTVCYFPDGAPET